MADVFTGGGEMGGRIRAFDWASTPLGPITTWPQSLKTAVQIMLHARYPMSIWWGRELLYFYNDTFTPFLGARHPLALGRPAAKTWSEIWSILGPQTEAVLNQGQSLLFEQLPLLLERNQFSEETYFTYSYSPLFDDNGSVNGLLCVATEDTREVLNQRRQRTLRLLAEQTARVETIEQACAIASRALAENPADLPFSLLYLLDGTQATRAGATGVDSNSPISPPTVDLTNPVEYWPLHQVLVDGGPIEVDNLASIVEPWHELSQRAVVVPVRKPGNNEVCAFVVMGLSSRLVFDDEYRAFTREIASQIGIAIGNAHTYEEERQAVDTVRAAAEANAKFRAFFDQGLRFAGLLAVDGTVIEVNSVAIKATGFTRNEVIGQCFWEGKWWGGSPDLVAIIWEATRQAGAGQTFQREVPFFVADGSQRVVDLTIAPVIDEAGRVLFLATHGTDTTERRAAEALLRASEERYRTLLDSIDQGFCVIEMLYGPSGIPIDYRFLMVNAPFERQSGLVDVVGKTARELVPTLEQHWFDMYGRVVSTGEPLRFEQGSAAMGRWFEVEAVRVGEVGSRQVALLFTDTTERKQSENDANLLAELSERLRLSDNANALLAEVAQLVGEYTHAFRCYFVEIDQDADRWTVRNDYGPPPSIAGSYPLSTYSEDLLTLHRRGQVISINDATQDPLVAASYEAGFVPFGIRAVAVVPLLRDTRWVAELVVCRDSAYVWQPREWRLFETIAERTWNAVEKLRVAAALRDNEEHLQTLYRQELVARQQAEEANRLKDDFLATVSHELRTPLTSILGYAQLMRTRQRDQAYTDRAMEKIVRSAQSQAQLIEDLLDVSRIVSGKLQIEPEAIDMVQVIHSSLDVVRPALDAKAIRLETMLDPMIGSLIGDAQRLQQVVVNLLSNAVKFTPHGGTVRVRWQQAEGAAQLVVSDTGLGISSEFLPFVFDRFRQAESASSRSNNGLGLGLSIVRHLVEMHGGTVRVQSEGIDRGATFVIQLPLSPRDTTSGNNHGASTLPVLPAKPDLLAGVRVLVVDDQFDVLELIHDVLSSAGAEVRTANAAKDGLAALCEWRPDVLVSDIAMPGEDGYWLIGNLRELPADQGGATPALALTAYVRLEERVRVLAAGFQLYVPKPVEPDELRHVVAQLAGARSEEDA